MIFKRIYRIVKDPYIGYQVDHRYQFCPFWTKTDWVNHFSSLKQAEDFILKIEKHRKSKLVKIVDPTELKLSR